MNTDTKYPKLKIMYGLDIDKDRVETVSKNKEWYKDHNYNPVLPGGQGVGNIEMRPTQELLSMVDQEYDSQVYAQISQDIEREWEDFMLMWGRGRLDDTTLNFLPVYNIKLTRYGTSGSYQASDTIILNIDGLNKDTVAKVIFHEIIHLTIEPFIQKYKIAHWYKERLVDLLFMRIFPEKAFEQRLPEHAYEVDPVFHSYYGDVEKIISKIA